MANPVPRIEDGSANRSPVAWQKLLVDGAITIDMETVILTKATALAATLAAPTDPSMDGFTMHIVSKTAAAHVITATNLINGNDDTLTFGGAVGDACGLIAEGGEWLTTYLTNVTVA